MRHHTFRLHLQSGANTLDEGVRPGALARRHEISASGKPTLQGSAATMFHGEADRWNPEELLIAALAQCHYLSFVYVASTENVDILAYECDASGTLEWNEDGSGQMTEVVMEPVVTVRADAVDRVDALHERAHELCFIARSVSCTVTVTPRAIAVS